MPFFSISNTNVKFLKIENLTCTNHTAAMILVINKKVEFINKNEFAVIALDKNEEIFMVYIVALLAMLIHSSREEPLEF